ncbi:hypothetical protein ACFWUQ_27245 [Streptomyces sp. NPDC058662]|uniref:hypothetical protein n=1 Tax=Streptomyces sp. NPDC058662 TaxID=3346583 RepID=UPI0036680750
MGSRHRFHLDQDGHSVTVLCGRPSQPVEVLVDGRVVARVQGHRTGTVTIGGEIAGDRPRPFVVLLDHPDEAGEVPICVLETEGVRYLMPSVPLTRDERLRPGRTPPARTPGELLARLLARHRARARGRGD